MAESGNVAPRRASDGLILVARQGAVNGMAQGSVAVLIGGTKRGLVASRGDRSYHPKPEIGVVQVDVDRVPAGRPGVHRRVVQGAPAEDPPGRVVHREQTDLRVRGGMFG